MHKHSEQAIEAEHRRFFQKVFAWMFLGLLVSALTSFFTASTPVVLSFIFSSRWIFYGLLILELLVVIYLAGWIKKMSASVATVCFLLYSFLTGLTLSIIFLVYTLSSIGVVFVIAGVMFGVMAVVGYLTKLDLSKMGSILIMGLIGIILGGIINIFLQNSVFDLIITILGVIIFTGLTAYDVQKIKKENIIGNEGTDEDHKEAIMGALRLYLDFINLFLNLLRLLGKRR